MHPKILLLTGATDGIGLATARMLVEAGHTVLVHGRNPEKLDSVVQSLAGLNAGAVEAYVADLSRLADVEAMAAAVAEKHAHIDVLINNAGVFRLNETVSADNLDIRFVVNTIAPYLLMKKLMPLLGRGSRVVNLSSAAQAPMPPQELTAPSRQSDGLVYAQSKLALTMWTRAVAEALGDNGPMVVSVNPKSMLGSKMVKEAYGVNGADLNIGADILCRAALSEEFAAASGQYFDNDIGRFAAPHPDALSLAKCEEIVRVMDSILTEIGLA